MLLVDSATDAPARTAGRRRAAPEGGRRTRTALAEAHFQLAIALKQAQAQDASRTAAIARGHDGDEVDAELRRAVELDPSHALAHLELGLRRASRGEIASGIEALRRAVTLAPGLAAAQRALAHLAVQREDWPTAVSALEAVHAWEPEDVPAAVALTSVLVRQHECRRDRTGSAIARVDSRRVGSDRELLAELKRCGF